MTTNISDGLRDVSGDELREVEGGNAFIRALVVIMTAEQQKAAVRTAGPPLVHEPTHQ